MNRTLAFVAASVCAIAASPALAQEMAPTDAVVRPDAGREGLYAKVGLGANYMSWSMDEKGAEASANGLGANLNLAAGYLVIPNLALFGEFNYEMALSPGGEALGQEIADEAELSMNFLSVGPGAAYFLSDDIFLQGSILYAQANLDSKGGGESDPATGFGLRVGAGKEFRMSDDFLLGAGANFFYGMLSNEVEGSSEGLSSNAMSFGVTLSASYN
ncbi:outer membrane beta-barrel protein [Vulgatibacter sp.]|uniref:outer membrane beta-barrel protein n=1 Tax=Vulgatibacter sp. TaxID=1971226 RepID=UPI003569E6A8